MIAQDSAGNSYEIIPTIYYHLTQPTSFMQHNARLNRGILFTNTAISELPGLAAVSSPYAIFNAQPQKEVVWERIRADHYPHEAPRINSLYCFENESDAEVAQLRWFANEGRLKVAVQATNNARISRADSCWLDCHETDWDAHARRYWAGEMTSDPSIEIIISGITYLPDWEEFHSVIL